MDYGWLIVGLLGLGGCAKLNADYVELDTTTSGPDRPTRGDTVDADGSAGTGGSDSTTTDAPPPATSGVTSVAETGHEATTADDTGLATSETGLATSETGVATTADPIGVVSLFASDVVAGDFASLGLLAAGTEVCISSIDAAGIDPACAQVVPVIASADAPFGELLNAFPALGASALISLDGEQLAASFEALVETNVDPDFANAVTTHLGSPTDPSFWWGPLGVKQPDCEGWSQQKATGQTRTFDSDGSGAVLSGINACSQEHRLLCACVAQ